MINHFDPTKPVVVSPVVTPSAATGPRTPEGKQISSRNALRHGCCSSSTLILKTENIEDYDTLQATWFEVYTPASDAEKHLVQELVLADWFLQRSTNTVALIEAQLLEETPNPLNWTELQQRTFARFLRYQTTRANTVHRCRKAIEEFRKCRTSEKHSEEKLTIAQQRLDIYREKNKPEPSIHDLIQQMMARKAEKDRLKQT